MSDLPERATRHEFPPAGLAWLTPDWPAPPGVRALSTFRTGGVSVAPYASFNLGDHVGDAAEAVAQNRRRLRESAGLPAEPEWLEQVHGTRVANLDEAVAGRADAAATRRADAAVTRVRGRVCAILTADCLPLLLTTVTPAPAVAAAHAGWRGLAAGVIEAAVAALAAPPQSLTAWLGPAIGPLHFEVGAEVRDALLATDPQAGACFSRNSRGRFMADLCGLARRRLERSGVERIFGGGDCTHAQPERYFSHRRDGRSGRQATLIWLE